MRAQNESGSPATDDRAQDAEFRRIAYGRPTATVGRTTKGNREGEVHIEPAPTIDARYDRWSTVWGREAINSRTELR